MSAVGGPTLAPALALAWAAWVLWLAAVPAGRPGRSLPVSRPRRRGPRAGLGVAAGVMCGIAAVVAVAGPLAGAVGVAAVVGGTVGRRRRRRRLAARRAAACVPELGELLRIAVAAGLTPALALEQVAELGPEPGRSAVAAALGATRRGRPLGDALATVVERLGPTAQPLVDALAATDRYGVPLEPVLDAAVADLRRHRRLGAQEAARRLPVTLSFPLVGCVLPAFALLTLAPLVAGAFDSLILPAATAPRRLGPPGPLPPRPVGGPGHARPVPVPRPLAVVVVAPAGA